ncbi:MAG: PGPGW domain-containing protein [Propionibacteriales bacterium]|nr:PGPGW domain-containing protein [Propionibacteriales bacterium]
MEGQRRDQGVVERVVTEVLGWTVVVIGIILWPLPGPGLLIILAGITILARQHAWARRVLDPLRAKAVEAARFGVATWPRIALSALGGVWLAVLGVVWWVSPTIPEFEVLGVGFGPRLPAAGWATGLGLVGSACAAWGLLVYSVLRWRER